MKRSADYLARRLSRRWLGQRGIRALYGSSRNGKDVIVVETSTGRRPQGLPFSYQGLQVVVIRGREFEESRGVPSPAEAEANPEVDETKRNLFGVALLLGVAYLAYASLA